MYPSKGDKASSSKNPCRRFSLAEIKSATKDFDDELVIGHGGFGKVYKAYFYLKKSNHIECHFVAIKRLDSLSNQGELEFRTEIQMLSKLRHHNLVSLVGFCNDNKEMILVYEYMPNGTLYDQLHKVDIPLNWMQRLKIAIGAGNGLNYLHNTKHGIIHRDVKSSNILLDDNWAAKISDFGLSKIVPTDQSFSASVKGTFGYLDPEYFYTKKLTRKTDVYAFGVVLCELLSGRLPVDERYGEEECSLFAQIANRCLLSVPKERPTMSEIITSLQTLMEMQQNCDNIPNSSGTTSFTWKIHKYLVSTAKQNSDQSGDHGQHDLKRFTYVQLKNATRNFENDTCFGQGVPGVVYKGLLDNGLLVAVKRLHSYKHLDFKMLKEFSHPNLVKLIGYCQEDGQLLLVYEFMLKGNFQDLLTSGTVAQLSMATKVKIVVGIARGIVFLHKTKQGFGEHPWTVAISESPLDRRNILLDEFLTAKLSVVYGHYTKVDIGHDRNYPIGFDPLNSNLFDFTVVIAELLTGKHISSKRELELINGLFINCGRMSLAHFVKSCYQICNKDDSELMILTMLRGYDTLIQRRLESWLLDPWSKEKDTWELKMYDTWEHKMEEDISEHKMIRDYGFW